MMIVVDCHFLKGLFQDSKSSSKIISDSVSSVSLSNRSSAEFNIDQDIVYQDYNPQFQN